MIGGRGRWTGFGSHTAPRSRSQQKLLRALLV
jgi:hypothetical protein